MKLSLIKAAVQSKAARQIFLAKKNSPTIFFVAGTVGIIGTVALACRATMKSSGILDLAELEVSHYQEEAGTEQMSHEDATAKILKIKRKAALDIAKGYLPAIGLGVLSIGALTGSHVILTKRNATVMAAFAALDKGFREYRQRVVEDYGKDVDRKYVTGVEDVFTEEKMADGSVITTSGKLLPGRFGGSPYAIVFDEQSPKFSKEPGRNAHTIMMVQSYANDKLKANGHLFLNEVYDLLGMPRTPAGTQVGWLYNHDENHEGDGYVDFGVWTGEASFVEAFIDGKHYYVTLDFNVDGPIWNKI